MKKKSSLIQTTPADKLMTFAVYLITILVALICFYPLYFTVIASFSDPYAVYTGKISFLPIGFTLEAYQEVMKNSQIWTGYFNTITYTLFGTAFNLVLTMAADLQLQYEIMSGVRDRIVVSDVYHPSRLRVDKYEEIRLLESFSSFVNYSPVSSSLFLMYENEEMIFTSNQTKALFQFHFAKKYGMSDDQTTALMLLMKRLRLFALPVHRRRKR